eukprot:IDg10471t1
MSRHIGILQASKAMRVAIPAAVDNSYEPGDQVTTQRFKKAFPALLCRINKPIKFVMD